jgi:streptogramin lyase
MKLVHITIGVLLLSSLIGCGGSGGSGNGGVVNDGKILISDGGSDMLIRMDNIDGDGYTTFGTQGSGVNQFNVPWGLDVDAQGRIYIADWGNRRIVRIDDFTGAGWTTFGTSGSGVGQFAGPSAVAVGPDGKIYIADPDNDRIVRIDNMAGAGWTTFGASGNGVNQFDGPYGLDVDSQSRIYIADAFNDRVARINDMTGTGWTTLTDAGMEGPGTIHIYNDKMLINARGSAVILTNLMSKTNWTALPMDTPQDAVMGESGRIYVVDQNINVLSQFTSIFGGAPTTYGNNVGDNEFDGPDAVALLP